MPSYNKVLMVFGRDAQSFLNGQITTHLPDTQQARYSLLLDQKGRIISDFFLFCHDPDHYLLCLNDQVLEATIRALQAKITSANVTLAFGQALYAGTAFAPVKESWSLTDPRHARLGFRVVSQSPIPDYPDYNNTRLDLGIPETADILCGKALPAEFGLDKIAIDFDKGCFVGQEVCARLRYQGKSKYHVHTIVYQGDLHAGQTLNEGNTSIGTVLRVYPQHAFIRVRNDIDWNHIRTDKGCVFMQHKITPVWSSPTDES